MTRSGFLVGTPGYMAPEQAGGKRALVGPATDIHALGVMLYQLLTGQLPFQHDSTLELLKAVTVDEPPRPRRLQPGLPRDLEAITLHCLEKEPSRRYPRALALAEDLERFRNGKQVVARPVGAVARLARACRRRPLVALLLALLAVSLLGGLAGVTWKWLEANEQRDLANEQRDLANEQRDLANAAARRADAEKQTAQYQAYRASLAAAGAALENHDVAGADRHLKAAPEALLGWEWRHLRSRLDDSSAVLPLPAGDRGIVIAGPDRLLLGCVTGTGLRITDLDGGEPMTVPIEYKTMRHVAVAQTTRGLRVAAWVDEKTIQLWDDRGRVLVRIPPPTSGAIYGIVVSPDGTRLAVAVDDAGGRIYVFDATSGKQTAMCNGHPEGGVSNYALSPDSSRLVTVSGDRTARVWNAANGALLATCRGHASKLIGLAFSPDGSRFVTTSADATVRQWNPRTGQEVVLPYDRHSGEVVAAKYSPDGRWLASVGTDRTVRVWRATSLQDVAILHGHTGTVVGVAFSPDGRRLVSQSYDSDPSKGAGDGTLRVWEVDPPAPTAVGWPPSPRTRRRSCSWMRGRTRRLPDSPVTRKASSPPCSVPTAAGSPRAVWITLCACGRSRAPSVRYCADIPVRSSASPSTPTARAWRRPAGTGRSGSGTWRGARRRCGCTGTRVTSIHWHSARTGRRWPPAQEIPRFACGIRRP